MTTAFVTAADIETARDRIAARIRRTPLEPSPSLSALCGVPVALKCEHHQITGAFKLRGATNAVLSLPPEALARGVVTVSTGNHGRAIAHAAKAEGARAVVCMSRLVPMNKRDAIAALGAETRIAGRSQDEAEVEAERLARDDGLTLIPPFDAPEVVAGQGTLGLEIALAQPDLAVLLVPLSGGGLAAGVAAAVKARCPAVRVIGVSMERGAAMAASLAAGRPVAVEEQPTLADSLGGGIGMANRLTFAMCRALLDDVVLLTEAEISAGIRHAYSNEREIVEGAGAVGIAALLAGKVTPDGPTVAILSGRNIDMGLHRRVLDGADGLEEAVA
ncbi:MAG: hydroxyectoine utilization dehydratase EutB [Gemmobacter sp.]